MKQPRPAAPSQAVSGVQAAPEVQAVPDVMSELRVSGHLMRLDAGLFCVVQTPTPNADRASGLPGVRLSLPPGPSGRPDAVRISGFGPDGWLSGAGDAALVRVSGGPAQLMVTIYQARDAREGTAPNLQVMRLLDASGAVPARADKAAAAPPTQAVAGPAPAARVMEMVAHIQERGDVGAMVGDWLGERGSKRWIEGFGIAPTAAIAATDIEYQAVLGPGWLSPWVEGGQFCGSRGMALPVLGLRVRLRGTAADSHEVRYGATFVDGSEVGPVDSGEPCEAESLAAMESFHVELIPRVAVAASAPKAKPAAAKAAPPTTTRAVPPKRPPLAMAKGKTARR